MEYKVGDEVYVKAQVVDTDAKAFEGYNHKVQFLDSINNEWDWVSESAISDKTYVQGLEDAWELARKIVCAKEQGGMKLCECEDVFNTTYITDILAKHTYEEALDKIEAYEREKEIKVGDVVVIDDEKFLVTKVTKTAPTITIDGMRADGDIICYSDRQFKKTGKHIDIEEILKQIGE